MKSELTRKRPVFLQPLKIELPVTATVSLAHRISGILLALALPLLVYGLGLSLRDAEGYAAVVAAVDRVSVKLLLVVLAWALAHHIAAGVRHMLFDVGVGMGLASARKSAWAVHAFAVVIALIVAGAVL